MQFNESLYEYFDYETKKFKILKIFHNQNDKKNSKENFETYNLIKFSSQKFLYDGKFHYPIYKNININVPTLIEDNKVKIKKINRNIQNIINNFLSKSLKIKNKHIENYFELYSSSNKYHYITAKKYDNKFNTIKNTYDVYINKGNGYFLTGFYYTIEEYNYRPHYYIINSIIKKIIFFYFFIISIITIFVIYFCFL